MAIADDEGPERRTHPAASANPSHRCKGLVHVNRLLGSGRSTREHCSHESLVMHCPDGHEPLSGDRSTRRSSRFCSQAEHQPGPGRPGPGRPEPPLRPAMPCPPIASAAMARVEVGVGVGATFAVRSVGPRHLVPDPFQAEQSPERRERSRRPQCRRPPPRPAPSTPAVDAPSPWVPLQGRYPFPG